MESVARSTINLVLASILSIVGGSLIFIGGLMPLAMLGTWGQDGVSGIMSGFGMGTMMGGGGGYGMMMPYQSLVWATIGVTSAISIGVGAVLIIGGYSIYTKPEIASSWGLAILVASIVGLFGMGDFLIGSIVGIIGGALVLARK